jgi:hypothetical protein
MVNVVMLTVTIKNITAVFYAKCHYADCHNWEYYSSSLIC